MSKIGVCKVWDDDKAYGFLKTEDGSETFIHMTACDGGKLAVGSEVRFDEDRGPDGRTKAKNVSLISGEIKKEAQRKGWMQRAHDGATAQRGGKDWLGRGGEQERKRTQAEIEMAEAEEEAIRRLSAGEKAADLIPQGPVAGPACGPMGPPGMAGCGPAVVAPPGMEHLEPEPVVERQPEDMNPEEIYEKLLQLYQHHRPHQLKNVGPMLIKYQGREAEILRKAQAMFANESGNKAKRVRVDHPPPDSEGLRVVRGLKGTRYEILTEGNDDGGILKVGDRAVCHAFGSLLRNKKKFWCTHDDGQPFSYDVGNGDVVTGWDKGCIGMREGEVRRLVVSSEDAYGNSGFQLFGIDGGDALVYVISLIKIEEGHGAG